VPPQLDQELLVILRTHLGVPGAEFAAAPRSLGGSFSEVFRFEMAGQCEPWRGPLVLRLCPEHAGPDLLRIERSIQNGLAGAGFPAPRVLLLDDALRLSGRRFMIVEHLPGRPFLRGVRPDQFAIDFPRLLVSWGRSVARVQAQLHDLDAHVVVDGLDDEGLGRSQLSTRRHVTETTERLDEFGGPGFTDAVDWLHENEPSMPAHASIVHGDLWPGNVLFHHRTLTGVIDWDRAGIGDPMLDVGFAKAGLALMPAPFPPPPPVAQGVHLAGRLIARDLHHAYERLRPLDASRASYYEALRCAVELAPVMEYRHRSAHDLTCGPRPPWDRGVEALSRHFTEVTGVPLSLDPAH
jgi:aminoglycoside phosphotransferase (APT) family kinase protein